MKSKQIRLITLFCTILFGIYVVETIKAYPGILIRLELSIDPRLLKR